jgi:hypothetical protein
VHAHFDSRIIQSAHALNNERKWGELLRARYSVRFYVGLLMKKSILLVSSGQYATPPFHGHVLKALPKAVPLPTTAFGDSGTVKFQSKVPGVGGSSVHGTIAV